MAVFAALTENGCVWRYANVYIKAVDGSGNVIPKEAYDGATGLHLGVTPATVHLKKKAGSSKPTLSVLIRNGGDGCPTNWVVVKVANWANSPAEAADATKVNEILVLTNDVPCK